MSDVTHVQIDEIEAIDGFFEGIRFHKAAAGLGISSFGMSIIELAPGADEYPEHDHSDGLRLLALGATPGEPYGSPAARP